MSAEVSPETLAELRRLLDEYPKTVGFQNVTDAWFALARAAINALPALLDAAADRDALRAKLDTVREWIDRRGVNVGDRDDDYMRGYRDAQRHAILDAAELRRILDGGDQ